MTPSAILILRSTEHAQNNFVLSLPPFYIGYDILFWFISSAKFLEHLAFLELCKTFPWASILTLLGAPLFMLIGLWPRATWNHVIFTWRDIRSVLHLLTANMIKSLALPYCSKLENRGYFRGENEVVFLHISLFFRALPCWYQSSFLSHPMLKENGFELRTYGPFLPQQVGWPMQCDHELSIYNAQLMVYNRSFLNNV